MYYILAVHWGIMSVFAASFSDMPAARQYGIIAVLLLICQELVRIRIKITTGGK